MFVCDCCGKHGSWRDRRIRRLPPGWIRVAIRLKLSMPRQAKEETISLKAIICFVCLSDGGLSVTKAATAISKRNGVFERLKVIEKKFKQQAKGASVKIETNGDERYTLK